MYYVLTLHQHDSLNCSDLNEKKKKEIIIKWFRNVAFQASYDF